MYVRATRVQTQPVSVQAAIDNFKQAILPRTRSAPGNLGAVLLVDRETGAGLGITYWESARAMAATEQLGIQVRSESVQAVPASQIVNVERFEVRIMERSGPPEPGAFARLTTVSGEPEKQDALTVYMRNDVLPVLKAQPGFRACILGVDRQTGRSVVSSVWESIDALRTSEGKITSLRSEAAKRAGATAEQVTVEIFESAVVDLSGIAAAARPTA